MGGVKRREEKEKEEQRPFLFYYVRTPRCQGPMHGVGLCGLMTNHHAIAEDSEDSAIFSEPSEGAKGIRICFIVF